MAVTIEPTSTDVVTTEPPSTDVITTKPPSTDVITTKPPSTDVITTKPPSTDEVMVIALDETITAYVSSYDVVNVRAHPDGDIIKVVDPATRVEIISKTVDESWSQVELLDETTGWIASFLLYESEFLPAFLYTPTPATLDLVTDDLPEGSNVVVNTDGSVTITLMDGTTKTVTGASEEWLSQNNNNTKDLGCDNRGNSCNSQGVPGGFVPPSDSNNAGDNSSSRNAGDNSSSRNAGDNSSSRNAGDKKPN